MPQGPRGEQRPADAVRLGVHLAEVATGEIEDSPAAGGSKSPAA